MQEDRIGIFTTDKNGVISSWGEWMISSTGIPSKNAIGQSLFTLFPDIQQGAIKKYMSHVLSNSAVKVLSDEFNREVIPCMPGNPSHCFQKMQQNVTISPHINQTEIIGFIFKIEDITDRIEIEQQMHRIMEGLTDPVGKKRISAIKDLFQLSEIPSGTIRNILSDENWRVRKAAVEEMISHYPPDQIDAIINDLKNNHHDMGLLNSIIQVLSTIGGDIVLPLIQLASTDDTDLKIYVLQTLGQQKDSRAIPALIQALDDPDVNVKYHAIEALGKLKAVEAADHLIAIIESNDFFQVFPALDALVNMGATHAVPKMIPLLKVPEFCEPVSEALGKLGDASITRHLAQLINQSDTPVSAITRALANLYERYRILYDEGKHIAHSTQISINQKGIQHLIQTIEKQSTHDLKSSALVLGWLKGEIVEDAIIRMIDRPEINHIIVHSEISRSTQFVEKLSQKLMNCPMDCQEKIIRILGRLGHSIVVPALIQIIQTIPDLIPVTVGALAQIGDHRISDQLIHLLGNPNPVIRRTIISCLCSIGSSELKSQVMPLLMDSDPYIRESAVKIVSYFGYEDAFEALQALTNDSDEMVRRAVIEHIWLYEDPLVYQMIANALEHDTPMVRVKAAESCQYMDKEEAIPLLNKALNDPFPRVRQSAIRIMGNIQVDDTKKLIAEIAASDPSHLVRISAIDSLGKLGDKEDIQLIQSLTQKDDPDIVITAIRSLGHMKQPEALPVLSDILQSKFAYKRAESAYAIRFYDEKKSVRRLKQLIESDNDSKVIETAIESLSEMKSDEAVNALIELSIDNEKREFCISAMSKMDVDQLIPKMTHPDPSARMALVEVTGRMKQPKATKRLIQFLNDSDVSVRLKAVTVLSDIHCEQAEPTLNSIIKNDPDPSVRLAAKQVIENMSTVLLEKISVYPDAK